MKLQTTFTSSELGRWVLNEENRIWKFFWKQRQNTNVWLKHGHFCQTQQWINKTRPKTHYMGFQSFCFASVFIYILRSNPSQDFNFWPSTWFSSLCFFCDAIKQCRCKSWKFQVAFTACSLVLLAICCGLSSFSVKLATVVTTVLQRILFIISVNIIKFHVKKQK